ncbi:TolC family protein [Lutibacter aestuarii]|uniref:TolC family protein n=1 Tax=Lutibacter aestuarii TaxID=861111 RepID=A0ABW2Z6D0_9FLAO
MRITYLNLVFKSPKSLVYLLFLATSISYSQQLTLKEAHSLLLSENGEISASNFELKAVNEEHKATKSLYLPKVGASGSYLRLDEDIKVDLNPQRNMIGGLLQISNPALVLGDWNVTLQEKYLGFATADLDMVLFAGGKINAVNKASEIKYQLAETHHHLKEEELTVKLINYYFKLKLAEEALKLREEVYQTVLLHNQKATKFFENGIIPEVETLNAKVALSNAKRELLAAKKDVSLALTAIQNLIGTTNFKTVSSAFIQPTILEPLADFEEDMLSENKQLKTIQQNYKLAKVGVKVENSEYFPKVALKGKYVLWKDNLPLVDTKWFAGIGIKWELFDGFKREHQIKASKFKVAQVEQLNKQAKLNLLTYTEKLYNTLQKELEQYESLTADQALAEKLRYMRMRAFEEGTGTLLEVVDATLKLTEIKLYKIKALCQYNITYGELMVQLGKTATFLNQI